MFTPLIRRSFSPRILLPASSHSADAACARYYFIDFTIIFSQLVPIYASFIFMAMIEPL